MKKSKNSNKKECWYDLLRIEQENTETQVKLDVRPSFTFEKKNVNIS